MPVLIPAEIKTPFLRALRRGRVRRILVWSPAIFLISGAIAGGFILWRGGGLLHLLSRFKLPFLSDDSTSTFWLAILSGLGGLLGVAALLGLAFKNHGMVTMPYCVACARPDETLQGQCESCGAATEKTADFIYPDRFDDAKIYRAFGLEK